MDYYLAVDIGASSGRHILGRVEDGRLILEEIYRFENSMKTADGMLTWDVFELFENVKRGVKRCAEIGKLPKSMAVDTWGVDYVLLGDELEELLPAAAYRDSRTLTSMPLVNKLCPQSLLYAKTGIQQQPLNTVYQLYSDLLASRLDSARHMLLMPCYLSYKLTGVIASEYTIASTTNLVNAETKDWDDEIIARLGFNRELFPEIRRPCTVLGSFTKEIIREVSFDCKVVLCPSHDTASAVAACPIDESSVYISSGTWSLIGTENESPILGEDALKANFTNEGGVGGYRFLKNIMGMWLFQGIRRDIGKSMTYDEMMRLAMESGYTRLIDPNDERLVAPESMLGAVGECLGEDVPLGDALSSVYHSLALSYKTAIEQIEHICKKKIENIFIVGGGSKDEYLNALTARCTGRRVLTGLTEATGAGNVVSQLMADRNITLGEARDIIRRSFPVKQFK